MDFSTDYMARRITEWTGAPDSPTMVYNTLVNGFNASTVLLVAGVVATLFGAFSASVFCLSVGLFLRTVTDKELFKYAVPSEAAAGAAAEAAEAAADARMQAIWERSLGFPASNPRQNIFDHLRIPNNARQGLAGWEVNALTFCDLEVWKNRLPLDREK